MDKLARLFKMAPNLFGTSAALYLEASQQNVLQGKSTTENTASQKVLVQNSSNSKQPKYKWKIVWRNVLAFMYMHYAAVYAIYLLFYEKLIVTFLFQVSLGIVAGMGITAGAHRLWAHRSYKAKWPLRALLMVLQTVAFQNHIYEWVRDHRVHHKFTDTDADPHNAKRGFFFSHMGWLLIRKHPDVIKKGATVDMSDLDHDPIVNFQRRTYIILMPLLAFVLPTWIPCYFWNEKPLFSWYFSMFRYILSLHLTWLVNSAAHIWGMKPYDRNIGPTENKAVAVLVLGEGWHNYHHVFPWDYKAGEFGNYSSNWTTAFINFFSRLGLAQELKTVSPETIKKRACRTGDGSRYSSQDNHQQHYHENAKWGWGDKDMEPEEIQQIEIINKVD
ncbi:acyl-CoA Delta-9 desaturase [Xylocopa sonorina]|uniref:acyl-CoA Delta-9 desaturase n=1 Tax=Xylocopa sonorina TaxID=1818115 RepID=UPI00403AE90A